MRNLIPLTATGRLRPSRRSRACARQAAAIKDLVRRHLGLGEDSTVSINEVACADSDCPDLETVIGVFRPGAAPLRLRVLKPLADVTVQDVTPLL
jgi:hypothetical protein